MCMLPKVKAQYAWRKKKKKFPPRRFKNYADARHKTDAVALNTQCKADEAKKLKDRIR
jgi:hypothetical protein